MVAVGLGLVSPVAAQADDIDELMEEMEELAREAGAKNETVKELEEDIKESRKDLARSKKDAKQAKSEATEAEKELEKQQKRVNGLANKRYDGLRMDPLTASLNADDPHAAVDRMSFMAALTRSADADLKRLAQAAKDAKSEKEEAESAVDDAAKAKADLEAKHKKLSDERDKLEKQVEHMEKRVDALNEQEREAWEGQHNPVDLDEEDVEKLKKASSSVDAEGVVGSALSKIGSPYGWGATGPDVFDCSGLMYWSYQQQGKTIPRTSQAQIAGGTPVAIEDLQPGDIVGYFPGVTHVGMYIGNGQVVHASTYGVPVQVVPLNSMPVSGVARY
ncbi:C40 family peptidase [Corynebacterium incognita]|uniref:C40 family peptidase n=2 Tax=Corynebacterium incognita TaxID=2754725 RepID=A0A7G7CS88_9CORY|nr:C40 family peptidase [Corynebacterium incognita]